ncbi:hypothetical protein [Geodermatophilus pulveris]|uniref:hypothetical protein n=1 Tax=Geodermatophilus pulveris TaxID=1564159 RepID=UPI00117B7322|nr:hypothetical protein [Geodermatophilus pulveris]
MRDGLGPQGEAQDRLLLRTSEVLAATDPLPGCLDPWEWLDRLDAAAAGAGADRGVTAGVGVTEVRAGDEAGELLGRADQAVYRAESAGGNRVTELAV